MIYLLIVIFHNTQSMTTTQSHCMDGIRWHLCLTASLSFLSGVFGLWAEKKRTKRNFNDIQWRHGPSMMFPVGKWCVFFVPLCPGTQTCMETPQKNRDRSPMSRINTWNGWNERLKLFFKRFWLGALYEHVWMIFMPHDNIHPLTSSNHGKWHQKKKYKNVMPECLGNFEPKNMKQL